MFLSPFVRRWMNGKAFAPRRARPTRRPAVLQLEPLEGRVVPTAIVLGASKDNTLYQSTVGNISNGAGSSFFAGLTLHSAIRRGVIAFDIVGNIPAGSTINSASLSLHVARTISGAQTVELHRLSKDWGEGTSNASTSPGQGTTATTNDATWVYRFYNTASWTNAGGDFVSTVSASKSVSGVGSYTWGSTSQMVTDVQGWLNTPSSNFGWLVLGNETASASAKEFDSRESTTAANRPALSIDYTSPTLVLSGFPAAVTAGAAATVTVTVQDAAGHTVTGYRGTVHFTSSDSQAVLPANYTFTSTDAGTHTFSSGVTLKTAGSQSVTATDTTTSSVTGGAMVTVNPAAASTFVVTASPATVTAGGSTSITVTAKDAFGNTATGYSGTVHFTSSDSQAVLPADATLTNGTGMFTVTLKTAGSESVTATDTADSTVTGSQSGIAVSAAAADHLSLSGPSSVAAGTAFDLTVTVLDAYNNVVTGYTGTVTFSSSDSAPALPSDYTFTADDAGTHVFSSGVILSDLNDMATVTAADTLDPTILGTLPLSVQ
jgi:plastocyanin